MVKKVEYILNYRIKGKKLTKKIEIDFVPYQRHVDYKELQMVMDDTQFKWNKLNIIESQIAILMTERPKEYIATIKELKKEIAELSDQIKEISNSGIIEKRFALLKEILIDNGYNGDEFLMSWDKWKNAVEPRVINEILEAAITKDIEKKKVVH